MVSELRHCFAPNSGFFVPIKVPFVLYLFFVFFHALFQNENIIYNMECQQIHLHTINPTK